MNWNALDFFIFLIILLNTLLGMSRGATKEIISLMCLSAALIITIKFTVPLASFVNSSPLMKDVINTKYVQNFMAAIGAKPLTMAMLAEIAYCISMLVCFVGAFSICEATLSYTGISESYSFPYATINRKLGAGIGATRGYVFSLFLLLILHHLLIKDPIKDSYFQKLFDAPAKKLDELILGQQVERYGEVYEGKDLYNEQNIYNIISSYRYNKSS